MSRALALFFALVVPAAAPAGARPPWQRLPAAPIAPAAHSAVWTGSELLVVGRRVVTAQDANGNPYAVRTENVAAAYTPRTRLWRTLAPPPGPASAVGSPHAVWTGRRMLVWNAFEQESYDPATDTWRRLPAAPTTGALVVWTGREMIGWGGGCCGDAFSAGSAYAPATAGWRKLPQSPLAGSQHPVGAWTGTRLLVVVGAHDPDGRPWPTRLARAASYDPAARTWHRLPAPPSEATPLGAAWDGSELLVVTRRGGYAYAPRTNAWRTLPARALGASVTATWARTRLLVTSGRTTLAYDPSANSWRSLPPAPMPANVTASASWTGTSLLLWGTAPTKTWGTYVPVGAAFVARGAS